MNEEIQTQPSQPQNGMNSMMIIGAVLVLAVIGFFVIRQTSQGEQRTPMDGTDTETRLTDDEGGSDAMDDENTVGGDAMMTPDQSAGGNTTGDTVMETTMDGDTMVINMEAGVFYFAPNTITVKKGQKVRIVMASKGEEDMMHDFQIDELDVAMDKIPTGETGTVEFVADTVGEFEYYCSVGEHRANGQIGTLIVEE